MVKAHAWDDRERARRVEGRGKGGGLGLGRARHMGPGQEMLQSLTGSCKYFGFCSE